MKNWIGFDVGSWHANTNDKTVSWHHEGSCRFDPAAVTRVVEIQKIHENIRGCIITFSDGGHIIVSDDLHTVIMEIQRALP